MITERDCGYQFSYSFKPVPLLQNFSIINSPKKKYLNGPWLRFFFSTIKLKYLHGHNLKLEYQFAGMILWKAIYH